MICVLVFVAIIKHYHNISYLSHLVEGSQQFSTAAVTAAPAAGPDV